MKRPYIESLIQARKSCRRFEKHSDEFLGKKEAITAICQAANSAPSAGNLQAYKCLVIHKKERIKRLAHYCQAFVRDADFVLMFFSDSASSSRKYRHHGALFATQDATIAATYAQLVGEEYGLGSCWIGIFNDAITSTFSIGDLSPIALIPFGIKEGKKTGIKLPDSPVEGTKHRKALTEVFVMDE
ncbi:hypothetical protein ADUPG1_011304 [Aduncisulcus paluster]|uniref:Nitroreductase domain-containing protein n=1 Tax=Aduncisulcus paluster TaxID=2918883 RepID=A0ABQ5JV39_9EUKA|nr:hypothetical protein ADUPG1_011304 [Aduncisulcus paluster]